MTKPTDQEKQQLQHKYIEMQIINQVFIIADGNDLRQPSRTVTSKIRIIFYYSF